MVNKVYKDIKKLFCYTSREWYVEAQMMTQSEKIRVAVLYGGRSSEHEVSLQSAANVIQYLDPTLFEVVPIGIDKAGNWFLGNEVYNNSLEHKKVHELPKEAWFTPEWIGKQTSKPIKEFIKQSNGALFDVVFPVVHGPLCEDGSLQGLLELAGLPYVGCGVLSSALSMDKDVAKRLALQEGIPVGPYVVIKKEQWQNNEAAVLSKIKEKITCPLFVKPANTGSSIGITKVKEEPLLANAINEAFRFDTKILVEKALNVIELEIAVLESLTNHEDPIVSVVGEIKPHHEFYSYDAKYVDEHGAELLVPAHVSEDIKEQARLIAKKLFSILECEGMARVDLFYVKELQQIYFNEINTIPGFTKISMYPKLMQASGIDYRTLLTHLVKLALKRQHNKKQLIRSYLE